MTMLQSGISSTRYDGCRMYTTAPKGTITPASHGVVAEKHCVAIAKIRLK